MTVFVVYSRFIDDPSIIKGIFTTKDQAMEVYNSWNDKYKDWTEVELDKVEEITLE